MMRHALCALLASGAALSAHAAGVQLYETGPSDDAAFIRFVSADATPAEVSAAGSQARIKLDPAQPATDYFPVGSRKPVKGTLTRAGKAYPIDLKVAPGEFATVLALPDGKGAVKLTTVREQADDFNALKAAVAFYSVDATCAKAGLQVAGKTVSLFKDAAPNSVARRMINPVPLSVQLTCGGKASGEPLDLGTLAAGQRYSVFAVPSDKGSRLFMASDTLAR